QRIVFMPFLLAEILDFQGSAHLIGVGSLSKLIFNLFICLRRFTISSFDVSITSHLLPSNE
ncbi:hypothetical protein, partial [Blautia massiliensis (ex Liu et al. 2021)]|uniref:hypothetical protein n=1 Tax=Blautia massiliensis (ex Liu et al. 2021) TaxID=3062492 RepID=UPI003F8BAB45